MLNNARSQEHDVNVPRAVVSAGAVVLATALIGVWLSAESRAQAPAPDKAQAIVGVWTLNRDLSDRPPDREAGRDGDQGDRRGGEGRRRGGGGFGPGGGGVGGGRFGRGGPGAGMSPDDMARMRDAMRNVMTPPDRLTIVQTETLVIITTSDGRTTRLSPDGKKIKDDSTRIERRTKWDGGKLVSEISGLGPGKMTETYSADSEHKQLHVTLQMENPRQPMTMNRVYDSGR